MAENPLSSELGMAGPPPEFLGGAFRTGRYGGRLESFWGDVVRYYDVTKPDQRMAWCLENMRVFNDGTFPAPAESWRGVTQHLIGDLKLSGTRAKAHISRTETKDLSSGLSNTELDFKAMMAVSAVARCMERSGGSASTYVDLITSKEGITAQSTQAEFLLHDDPKKLNRVIENPIVKRYYDRLINHAGLTDIKEWTIEEKEDPETGNIKSTKICSDFKVDRTTAIRGKLVEYLKDKARKGGFNEFIADVLLAEDSEEDIISSMGMELDDTARWAAAKLACDAFMADKYTRWEYEIDKDAKLGLQPTQNWGGDPFRMTIEPSFLARKIKKVYKEDKTLLDLVDNAFRPLDIFGQKQLHDSLIEPTGTFNLSRLARFNDALWQFLGGSRADAIPNWSEKTIGETLHNIAELLDQVYGETNVKNLKTPDGKNVGKHIVGSMMIRILHAKAFAVSLETDKPNWRDYMNIIFGREAGSGRPFFKVEQFLWGQNLDATDGFLKSLASGRTRFVFKDNMFLAENYLSETWSLLSSNDQNPRTSKKMLLASRVGFVLEVLQEAQKIWIRGR